MQEIKSKKGNIKLPVMNPIMVPTDKVMANNYNPNNVSKQNMDLLEQSILDNGFCFPIVTIYDDMIDKYIIIDGFHRYTILKDYLGLEELPIVVLDHDSKQRMAATVQFNRARGVHQVELMGDLIQALVNQGATDEEIAKHLGMEDEEVFRLKQITGIAEVFKNQSYSTSWKMEEINEVGL